MIKEYSMRTCKHSDHPTVHAVPIAILFCLTLVLAAPGSFGAFKGWSPCRGPEGAVIDAIAIDPTNSEILYIGTDADGVYKSTDGGENWIAANSGITNNNIRALKINPQSAATVYAATSSGGVFRSTDGGGSWAEVNSGLANLNIVALAIKTDSPSTVYVATNTGGVFRSTDGGESWSAINSGLTNLNARSLAINPQTPATIYAGTQGGGIFKTTDAGDTWSSIFSSLSSKNFQTMIVDPQTPSTIYTGTNSGLYRSTNSGRSWSAKVEGLSDVNVLALAVDPQHSATVYAGTNGGGLFKSTDNGEFWSEVSGVTQTNVRALATDPQNAEYLYAGTNGGGVFKSSNSGDNWSEANGGLAYSNISTIVFDPTNPQIVYASSSVRGVFRSADGCASWSAVNNGLSSTSINALAVDPDNPASLYTGTSDGKIFKSTNSGADWSDTNSGLTNAGLRSLVVDPQNPSTVYAAYAGIYGSAGGVLKSTDGGGSWSEAESGLPNASIFAMAINSQVPSTLYVGMFGSGVYKTTDGGANWSAVNTGLTIRNVWSLVADPQNPETLFAGIWNGGVFKSTDGGANWNAANTGITSNFIWSLAVDPQNSANVYAGASNGAIFKSTDGGANWQPMNTGLPNSNVFALAVDPSDPERIYAATSGRGVWVYLPACASLTMGSGGAATCKSSGGTGTTLVGYASVDVGSGAVPYGTAVFSYKQNGATVTEAGVPASPPTTQARLFIDYRSAALAIPGRSEAGAVDINTGIAVVNYGSATADVTYTLRNMNGDPITSGTGTIPARRHFAGFINQFGDIASGFSLPANFPTTTKFASLEITSSQALSILALRMTTNQRGEVLYTTLPVADLTEPAVTSPVFFPQFADGGGYTTALVLLNTSGTTEMGTLQIMDDTGAPVIVNQVGGTADSTFNYTIPSGGAFRFQTDGSGSESKVGWIRLTPDGGSSTPVGSGVFGYNPADALISESGVPAAASTTHARVYVDLSGDHNTGLAIANVQSAAASITINAFQKDGVTAIGTSEGPLDLTGNGHKARFANQFIRNLPAGFTGVLDISSTTPFAALTLRSLINERDEFLMTAFPIADADKEAPSPIVFPQIADDGGYVTEFILLSPEGASSTTVNLFDEDGASLP